MHIVLVVLTSAGTAPRAYSCWELRDVAKVGGGAERVLPWGGGGPGADPGFLPGEGAKGLITLYGMGMNDF